MKIPLQWYVMDNVSWGKKKKKKKILAKALDQRFAMKGNGMKILSQLNWSNYQSYSSSQNRSFHLSTQIFVENFTVPALSPEKSIKNDGLELVMVVMAMLITIILVILTMILILMIMIVMVL